MSLNSSIMLCSDSHYPNDEYIQSLKDAVDLIGAKVVEVLFVSCDKEQIKKTLIYLSNKNKNYEFDMVIVHGVTSYRSTFKTIKEVIDKDLSYDILLPLKDVEFKLAELFDHPVCGIRKRTFIFNMCGPQKNVTKFFKQNGNMLLELIFAMSMLFQNSRTDNDSDNNSDKSPEILSKKKQIAPNTDTSKCTIQYDNNNSNNNDNNFDPSSIDFNKQIHITANIESPSCSTQHDNNNNNNGNNNENNSDISSINSNKQMKDLLESKIPNYEMRHSSVIHSVHNITGLMYNVIKTKKVEIETVRVSDAYGRILTEDICSNVNVPNFKTSTKNGYAMLASDGQSKRKVLATPSTIHEVHVTSGTCIRVRSGKPIPNGATTVVALNDTKIINEKNDIDYFNINEEYEIELLINPKENENIRNIGCDVQCNQKIISQFTRIGSAEMGILTLCGFTKVTVVKPSIGLLSIGDNLWEAGDNLPSGFIYDSNRITVKTLLKENGFDTLDFGISDYRINSVVNNFIEALEKVNVLVTMGHANKNDIIKFILLKYFNATIHFDYVNMKPGKSTIFATAVLNKEKKYFLCMSANVKTVPVVTHLLLLPFLNRLYCHFTTEPNYNIQTCINSQHKLHSRPKFSWTYLQWTDLETFPRSKNKNQDESLMEYQKANALLMLPPRTSTVQVVDKAFVPTMLFNLK